MTHQQIIDKLAARHLVQSIDEDLARLVYTAMCFHKDDSKQASYILTKLLLRWNCVLKAGDTVSVHYKKKTVLALAVLLHKYGFTDNNITAESLQAIDDLNADVVLDDDFFRKSEEIKKFLTAEPVKLKRKPTVPENITFYRPKDVISIQLDNRYYAAYIHRLSAPNESTVIEFYDGIFDHVPTLAELERLQAKGQKFNDGLERVANFSICGLKFLPDLANQVQLISACIETKPSNSHLSESIGLYTVKDIFMIQDDITAMFQ
ncbi:hypothetical protein HHL16_21805 [Pseudoflavitalea sp. G-6-1-2]|uniref:hypothetical protein n=1 Tax=Pseudoflavitalea sp. G-6-1-2 TaxID=2728841 RepID=UPI00146EFF10|nr:hypothetical protein [Pseudoflavitalea sp. G-6-1-2]NML23529.1 hypothetical protein [Pseudoflavitalea sp. G-6-1-2]